MTRRERKKRILRRSSLALTILAGSLALAASAAAAPVLEVQLSREPTTLHKNDEWAAYEVKVKNASPTDAASGSLSVSVALPAGMTLLQAEGPGWTCPLATATCTSTSSVAAGGFYPTLKLAQVLIEEEAPEAPTVTVTASGGGAAASAQASDSFVFEPAIPFGLESLEAGVFDPAGNDYTQAGGHPFEAKASFRISKHICSAGPQKLKDEKVNVGQEYVEQCWNVVEDVKEGFAELPPGLVGNPEALDACTVDRLLADKCPESAAAGGVGIWFDNPHKNVYGGWYPVFKLVPSKGYPAEFGFKTLGPSFSVRFTVRSNGDYGLTGIAPLVPQDPTLFGSDFIFCGVGVKKFGINSFPLGPQVPSFTGCKNESEANRTARPIVTMPTNCTDPEPKFRFGLSSWLHPGARLANGYADYADPNWKVYETTQPAITGCEKLVDAWTDPSTQPTLSTAPDNLRADTPAAYETRVHVDNSGLSDFKSLAASHLRDIEVSLPPGVAMNPAVGDGVETCSEAQMGRLPGPGIHYDFGVPNCPRAAKLGNVFIETPLLENPLRGSVYLGDQNANPFNSDFAIYLVVEEPKAGLVFKLPGEVTPDRETGAVIATFLENPQLPFEDLQVNFFGGAASALVNPRLCGQFSTETELTPWAAQDPVHPRPDEIVHSSSPIQVETGAGGATCAARTSELPFDLGFEAGTRDPLAGATSPFSLRITRADGKQEMRSLTIQTPPGFSAYLRGVAICSDAQIESAAARSGLAERSSSSCPGGSRIGSVLTAAGAGSSPLHVPGSVYLAGPYKGAPLSVVTMVPALAGGTAGDPAFDFGTVVVRAALRVDPVTAQIEAVSDPLPHILHGIPIRLRELRVDLDRPDWSLNPTSCEPMTVRATVGGDGGGVAELAQRFQVGGCERLAFKPKLRLDLQGGVRRNDNPALVATLTQPFGQANIGAVSVALPHSAFLDQSHIRTICTRVQYAANACPPGSIYGEAEATTPLLDEKLEGNVYLRSSNNKLPDLAIALRGPAQRPIAIDLVGRIDSVHGGIRTTFETVPDAPVSKFVLRMRSGKRGLLVNSRNLCTRPSKATVRMTAQNGKQFQARPKLSNDCKGKRGKKKSAKGRSPK